MTTPIQVSPVYQESTYQLLVQSEEKERGLIEGVVYLLLVIATTTSIWQFGRVPVTFAEIGEVHAQQVAAWLQG
ncbi:MAG: hypothetical protein WCE51_16240 [Chthoniobacterales bacterium]|jgi:hypothetical protein